MSTIYLLVLIAVAAAFVGVTLSAVLSVSTPPVWEQGGRPSHHLQAVITEERRVQQIAFVGSDRRHPAEATELDQQQAA